MRDNEKISLLKSFFNRNIFERIILYIIVSFFFNKFYAEIIYGESAFYHPRIKQWMFYGLLGLDYIISWRKLAHIRFEINHSTIFSFVLFIMIMHSTAVGIFSHNPPFTIFNDIVPLLMIALNILRMQSAAENSDPIDFSRLLRECSIIYCGALILEFALWGSGFRGKFGFAIHPIYLAMILCGLFTNKRMGLFDICTAVIIVMVSISGMNRTSLAFILASVMLSFCSIILKKPLKSLFIIVIAAFVALGGYSALPEDSMLRQRIGGLQNIDFSQRTGSIGERQQEWDSINQSLSRSGPTYELLGMGMGGTFTMHFTHYVEEDYGHAHYSWSWFKMRFGNIGFVYLAIMATILVSNLFSNMRSRKDHGIFISLLCIESILYLATYVNAVFLMSGVNFLYVKKNE